MKISVDLPAVRFVEKTGRQVVDEARAAEHRLVGLARHARHPGLVEHDRRPRRREARRSRRRRSESYTLDGVELFPVQPEPVDQAPGGLAPKPNFGAGEFSDKPFRFDSKTYASDAKVPAAPAFGKALGQARDLNIAGLHFPAAQYNPKTDKLEVLTHVDVEVDVRGRHEDVLRRARLAVGDGAEPLAGQRC